MIRKILFVLVLCALTRDFSSSMIHRSRRSSDTCGVPKNPMGLVVRGESFSRGQFPWIVALTHTGWRPPKFFCAGTLISKTFVISAAHCILQKNAAKELLPRNILALFGAHDLTDNFEAEKIAISPKKIHIHDDWNHLTSSYDADISLLEFWENKIHFGDFVQPICLWSLEEEPEVTEGVVTGWGQSENKSRPSEDIPKLVKAPIWSNEECFFDDGKQLLDMASRRTFCAGLKNGSGVCQGDSGGGLFIKVEEVFYLRGIVSSSLISHSGCDVWRNAIYTNVLKFKEWIEGTVGTGKRITAEEMIEETTLSIPTAARKVFCVFSYEYQNYFERRFHTCNINETIEIEDFVMASPKNTSIEFFEASFTKQIKYLPRGIGEKFPNLKIFIAFSSGLTIVRDFYFKNMGKLDFLTLYGNQIKTIEPKAFDDLVSLRELSLNNNQIETLNEKLFVKLVKLEQIGLFENKIKVLSPTTFNIPGNGKLSYVDLRWNVCINKYYGFNGSPLNQLESDLRTNCLQ